MKKRFICLANSKKYTQRCIAGIELTESTRKGYTYDVVRHHNKPVWIRPVSNSEHGEIEAKLVAHVHLLDVVEIDVMKTVAKSYQSENMLLNNQRLRLVNKINKTQQLLNKLLPVKPEPLLFGNRGKAVPISQVEQLDYSLILIKPENVKFTAETSLVRLTRIRATFTYGTTAYNLAVTDIDFIARFDQNSEILHDCSQLYFTISLGLEFNEYHYKLIAGIVCF